MRSSHNDAISGPKNKTSQDSGKIADLIKEFGLTLRPQLVNLDLSHDEELLLVARWRDNSAGSESSQGRTTTLLSKNLFSCCLALNLDRLPLSDLGQMPAEP